MGLHFAHYLPRRVVSYSAKAQQFLMAQAQEPGDGFDRPQYHVTRQRTGPATRIQPGDTIWLFSTLSSPWGTLPPSLDAQIIVERREELPDGTLKFHAAEGSQWFLLANATDCIKQLTTKNTRGEVSPLLPPSEAEIKLGNYLQSARLLVDVAPLAAYSTYVLNGKYSFISYRLKDGMKGAFEHADRLLRTPQTGQKHPEVLFWDRYCLPRRLVERREVVSSTHLDELLFGKIRAQQCDVVWGVETPGYLEESSYGAAERRVAKEAGKYQPVCPSHR